MLTETTKQLITALKSGALVTEQETINTRFVQALDPIMTQFQAGTLPTPVQLQEQARALTQLKQDIETGKIQDEVSNNLPEIEPVTPPAILQTKVSPENREHWLKLAEEYQQFIQDREELELWYLHVVDQIQADRRVRLSQIDALIAVTQQTIQSLQQEENSHE